MSCGKLLKLKIAMQSREEIKMKKNIFTKTLAVVALFFAVSAQAEENYVSKYTCGNIDNSVLYIFQADDTTLKKAIVHLTVKGELKIYEATYELALKTPFTLESYEYQLFEKENKVGTVKVATQKKIGRAGGFCGRAGCDLPTSPLIPIYSTYASIQLGDYEDSFDCE